MRRSELPIGCVVAPQNAHSPSPRSQAASLVEDSEVNAFRASGEGPWLGRFGWMG